MSANATANIFYGLVFIRDEIDEDLMEKFDNVKFKKVRGVGTSIYGHHDYRHYYISITSSEISAGWEGEALDANKLYTPDGWRKLLERFCGLNGIKFYLPKWWLVPSYF